MTHRSSPEQHDRSSRLVRSAALVAAGICLSRIVGIGRDIVFASVWGTTPAMAAYIIAFTAPNLLRSFFAEGAFAAGFVPVFTQRIQDQGLQKAWTGANRVLSVLLVAVSSTALLVAVIALFLTHFVFSEGMASLTLELISRMIPYAVFVCLSGALTCALTSFSRFSVPGFSPVILNVTLIITALFIAPLWGESPTERIRCLTFGVLLAGSIQLGIHLIACGIHGLRFHFRPAFRCEEVRRVSTLMLPAVFGAAALQLNVAADRILAGLLGNMATTSLYYSQRLAYLPIGIFGVAITMVCLPSLSRAHARNDDSAMSRTLGFGLRQALFLTLPVAGFLAVLQVPVIRLLFEHGLFSEAGTAQTRWALSFFLPGIPAFVCTKVATMPYHAQQDTKTPVKIMSVCLALNIALNIVLMQFLAQGGIALASTMTAYLNVTLLLLFLSRCTTPITIPEIAGPITKIALAAAVATVVTALARNLVTQSTLHLTGLPAELAHVFIPLTCGGISYLVCAILLQCEEVKELWQSIL